MGLTAKDRVRKRALLSCSESHLVSLAQTAPREKLLDLYRLGLVCRCTLVRGHGFGMRRASCDDNGVPVLAFMRCPHRPETTFSPAVQSIILARLWPREYGDPEPDAPANAASRGECYAVRLERAQQGRRLFHPGDATRADRDGLPDSQGISVVRARNGNIVEVGRVQIQGAKAGRESA